MYNKEILEKIRSQVDILTFLENRGISFRQTGNAWVGLCPVHNERTPSFNVNTSFQTFRCFGCGIHGDIFSLVQEIEGLSFPGAVLFLADELGLKIEATEDPEYKKRSRLLTIVRLTSEWYRYNYKKLPNDHPAKINLEKRNLLLYSIKDESVGFAPRGDLIRLLQEKDFTIDEIIEAGLAVRDEKTNQVYERFRERLIWTIYNPQGHPIAFSARKIFDYDQGPKYLNSPQTPIFNKSKALLGLNTAKKEIVKTQQVYIVEGQTDVMALKDAGFEGTVASCGTAFGKEHANMLLHLSKMGSHSEKFEMIFCFDGDAAGIKAAKKVFAENPNIHLNAYAVKFLTTDGEPTDPCDYRLDYGNENLVNCINTTKVPLIEFVLSELRKEWNLNTPEGQSGYITAALTILDTVGDRIQHGAYLRKVAAWSGVSYTELSTIRRRPQKTPTPEVTIQSPEQSSWLPVTLDITLLAGLLQHPTLSLNVINEYQLTPELFENFTMLATKVFSSLQENTFDYEDEHYSQLAHLDTKIDPSRANEGLTNLVKTFLRSEYMRKSNQLDGYLLSSDEDPTVVFQKIVEEQEKLKQIYRQI